MKFKTIITVLTLLLLAVLMPCCKTSISETSGTKLQPDKVFAPDEARDSDRDGLTDQQEAELGTNPNDRDTDHDGLTDGYELSYDYAASIGALSAGWAKDKQEPVKVDQDQDKIHAALDNDDNGNSVLDGEEDADGDGVPNALEFYGYKYNALNNKFEGCRNGQGDIVMCPKEGYYFTDPTQFSTDQDPYGDGMEVSNVGMDQSVKSPADNPLIPAYADVYVAMRNFTVTPIKEITTSRGGQTQNSWTNSTTDEKEDEFNWNVQTTAGGKYDFGLLGDFSLEFSLSAGCGGRYASRHSVTSSKSGFTQEDWNTATTVNTSQAANLTLDLLFQNKGTASASEIKPTFNLKLGDELIMSYTVQEDNKIDVLPPGGESTEFAYGDQDKNKITITMDQLQKIQMGVPLLIGIPQMGAMVAKQDGKGGWTKTQQWADYQPSIEAVCAHLTIDSRDASKTMVDYLVYASSTHKNNNGPRIKLKDILGWVLTDDFQMVPGGGLTIYGKNETHWAVGFSENAWEKVKAQLNDPQGANGDLMEVVVYQDSPLWEILFSGISESDHPEIHWAYYSPVDNSVSAYVTDYFGIESVYFIVSADEKYELIDDKGTGVYKTILPGGYTFRDSETVKVKNVRDKEIEKPVAISGMGKPVWSMFKYDSKRTGRCPYSGAQEAVQKWQFETGYMIDTSPAIGSDGTIYVGSCDGNLYAIKPDGKGKWAYKTGNGEYSSSPAVGSDGTIYVGSHDGNLYAIQPDGQKKWEYETAGCITSCPAIGSDETIYVGSEDGNLYAIQPHGQKKWAYKTGGKVYFSPAIGSDGTIYVGSFDGNLYAIKPDGQKKWVYEAVDGLSSESPAIGADGTIYVGSYDGNLYAIQPNGQKKWVYQTGPSIYSSPAIGSDETIYVGSQDGNLYAIKPDDGKMKWAFKTGSQIRSSPAVGSDGTIYVGSYDSYLYAIKPDGQEKWAYKTGGSVASSPTIGSDGTIYVGSGDFYLYAIGDNTPGKER